MGGSHRDGAARAQQGSASSRRLIAEGEEDGWTWTARVDLVRIEVGAHARLFPLAEPISPELRLAIGPALSYVQTDGERDGASFPTSHEHRWEPSGRIGAGLAGRVGHGTLEGHVDLSVTSLGGALTGSAALLELSPGIAYRIER